MIVCVCKVVSDRHIKAAVKSGAGCLRDLTRELGVGTCCGKCLPEAKAVLLATLDARKDAAALTYFPAAGTEFAV